MKNTVECYELANRLKENSSVTTDDGWTVHYAGKGQAHHKQLVCATKGTQVLTINHYPGSEGVARILRQAREKYKSIS